MPSPRTDQILADLLSRDRGSTTLPELLCAACVDAVPVAGAGMALISDNGHEGVIAATDGNARLLEDLQFTHGEGPCIDASRERRPVLEPDLERVPFGRWPAFTPAVLGTNVAAVFAFPMQVGAIRLGVLDLYRTSVGVLEPAQLAEALAFADAAVVVVLHLQSQIEPGDGLHAQLTDPVGGANEIHQATGMVAVQASVSLADALQLLCARAYAEDTTAIAISRKVLNRRLRFDQ